MSKGDSGGGANFSRDSSGRKVYEVGDRKYVRSPSAVNSGDVVVMASVAKLDKEWSKDSGFYIPPGGGGAEIGGRRQGFRDFQKSGKPIEMSRVDVSKGQLSFVDGRHRMSVIRDQGARIVPVTVSKGQAAAARKMFGIESERRK